MPLTRQKKSKSSFSCESRAKTSDFEKAVRIENEALMLLKDGEAASDFTDFTARLKLHEANVPYREP